MDLNQRIFHQQLSAMIAAGGGNRLSGATHEHQAAIICDFQQREAISDALQRQREAKAHGSASRSAIKDIP